VHHPFSVLENCISGLTRVTTRITRRVTTILSMAIHQ
jgi:hypothetical protein